MTDAVMGTQSEAELVSQSVSSSLSFALHFGEVFLLTNRRGSEEPTIGRHAAAALFLFPVRKEL